MLQKYLQDIREHMEEQHHSEMTLEEVSINIASYINSCLAQLCRNTFLFPAATFLLQYLFAVITW